MTVTFSGSPLSKGKLLAGSGDRKTDFICRDWDLEGANSCKFTINSSANINTGEERGFSYTSQENAFRLEIERRAFKLSWKQGSRERLDCKL